MVNLFWRPEPWRVQFPSSISDMGFSGNILPWDLIVHQFIHPSFSLFEYGLWGFNPFSDTPISLSLSMCIYIYMYTHNVSPHIFEEKNIPYPLSMMVLFIKSLARFFIHTAKSLRAESPSHHRWALRRFSPGRWSFYQVNLAPNFRSKNPILKQW